MPTWTSRELIRMLLDDGWEAVAQSGSHRQFRHPSKPGRVTVPADKNSIPQGTVRSVYRQAGWDWITRKR